MEQLNQDFINPYNATRDNFGLEQSVKQKLKNGLTDCNTTRVISYYIQERSDFFSNQLHSLKPSYKINCPISAPLMQREHEVVLGYLLNRLRIHALRTKSCPESTENRDRFERGLKKIAENRFGNEDGEIKSCKRSNVAIGGSCINTGVLTAGAGK
jgi:hypothetical protein